MQHEKDTETRLIEQLEQEKVQLKEELVAADKILTEVTAQRDEKKGNNRLAHQKLQNMRKTLNKAEKDQSRYQAQYYEHKANQQAQDVELQAAEKECRSLHKQLDMIRAKAADALQKCSDFEDKKLKLDGELKLAITQQEEMQKRVEDKKKEINAKIHERTLLNGDLVTQEEAERKAKEEVLMYEQQLTKIKFKKQSYAIAMQKLSQENIKLEKDKETYAD